MKLTTSLGALILLALTGGCAAANPPAHLATPPRPPAPPRVIEYEHRMLKEISEEQRIEKIIEAYGELLQEEHQARTLAAKPMPDRTKPELQSDWLVDPWEMADTRVLHHRHHDYHWQRRWQQRYYNSYEPFSVGNTLLFGTLGGILGHQSGHRDEGILIGAAYGFLRDLLSW